MKEKTLDIPPRIFKIGSITMAIPKNNGVPICREELEVYL